MFFSKSKYLSLSLILTLILSISACSVKKQDENGFVTKSAMQSEKEAIANQTKKELRPYGKLLKRLEYYMPKIIDALAGSSLRGEHKDRKLKVFFSKKGISTVFQGINSYEHASINITKEKFIMKNHVRIDLNTLKVIKNKYLKNNKITHITFDTVLIGRMINQKLQDFVIIIKQENNTAKHEYKIFQKTGKKTRFFFNHLALFITRNFFGSDKLVKELKDLDLKITFDPTNYNSILIESNTLVKTYKIFNEDWKLDLNNLYILFDGKSNKFLPSDKKEFSVTFTKVSDPHSYVKLDNKALEIKIKLNRNIRLTPSKSDTSLIFDAGRDLNIIDKRIPLQTIEDLMKIGKKYWSTKTWKSVKKHGIKGYMLTPEYNFNTVVEGKCYKSNQLNTESFIKVIKEYNIDVILNLRGENEYDKEAVKLMKKEGHDITLIDVPISATSLPPRDKVIKILDVFEKYDNKILLIHCMAGADRSGLVSALYLIEVEKKSKEEALKMLTPKYNHIETEHPNMRKFIKMYKGRDWLEKEYTH